MLSDADVLSRQLSGQPSMWRNPYARPDARRAITSASVWFTAYPISLITRPGESFLGALGDGALWEAFQQIGIDAVHTGPVKRAGGLSGWMETPSVDGHFDRISTRLDPVFGTEDEFRSLCEVADSHGGSVLDDIVPGHTGKGADFRLAEMAYEDYPGIYHMVEIPEEDWHLLPDVPEGRDAVNLDAAVEHELADHGYIIGALQRVIFYAPGIKETNWSATAPVTGVDGRVRRWVYLHYFKMGQPSINWLDPTFAGMRLVIGDALHSLGDLGTHALRLDANGFLGVEKSAEGMPAWSEGHPLSHAANHVIAGMVRKVGGFTFQELNLAIEDIRDTGRVGADLSYDFVNRPAYQHALATGDTEFLRLTLRTSLEVGVDPVTLVHALQNHDELTYELVHWATLHATETYEFRGGEMPGHEIAEAIRADLLRHITGEAADYNLVFTTNGIACTTASVIAATQGHTTLDAIEDEHVEQIRRAHLLLAMFNAWQPGVFALSGWDLRRRAAGAGRPGGRADRDRRHPLDRARRARPDGRRPRGHHLRGGHAARTHAVRVAARAARHRGLVPAGSQLGAVHPGGQRRRRGHPDRRARRGAPGDARAGAPPRRRRRDPRGRHRAGDGAELHRRADRGLGAVRGVHARGSPSPTPPPAPRSGGSTTCSRSRSGSARTPACSSPSARPPRPTATTPRSSPPPERSSPPRRARECAGPARLPEDLGRVLRDRRRAPTTPFPRCPARPPSRGPLPSGGPWDGRPAGGPSDARHPQEHAGAAVIPVR